MRELWTDEDFEMIAVEVKGRDPKFTWKIVGIYGALNEDMRVIERLAARTDYIGNSTKRSIIGGDLNLPFADWNGNAGGNSETHALLNTLVWENGYSQVADSPSRGDALLEVYVYRVRLERSFTSSSIVQGISDYYGVMLEVEWEESGCEPQVEGVVPLHNETDVRGYKPSSAINSQYGQATAVAWRIWNNLKNIIYECIERFVPRKNLEKVRTLNITIRNLND